MIVLMLLKLISVDVECIGFTLSKKAFENIVGKRENAC